MISSSFLCPTADQGPGGAPDRAGNGSDGARPVLSRSIRGEVPGHFQSDGDFATRLRDAPVPAWAIDTIAIAQRSQRAFTRAGLIIAATAVLWAVLPALCMWLAGGTPA